MLTILVSVLRDSEQPRRLFWSLASRRPPGPFEVVVADRSPSGVGQELDFFRASFPWKHLRPGDKKLEEFVSGANILSLPGFAIPVGTAVQTLLECGPAAVGACEDIGVYAVEALDDWGTNLHDPLLVDCLQMSESFVRLFRREQWATPFPAQVEANAPFVLLTPPDAAVDDYWLTADDAFEMVETNS